MRALLYQDIQAFRATSLVSALGFVLITAFIGIVFPSYMASIIFSGLITMTAVGHVENDSKNNITLTIYSMPIKRTTYINEKFFFVLATLFVSTIAFFPINILFALIHQQSFSFAFANTLFALNTVLVITTIFLAIYFIFKHKNVLSFIFIMALMLVAGYFTFFAKTQATALQLLTFFQQHALLFLSCNLLLYALVYVLSRIFYQRRDL